MTLLEQYQNGETTKVYEEIYAMGTDAFTPAIFNVIDHKSLHAFVIM